MSEKKLENWYVQALSTLLKVDSANGQKFHNYSFRMSFDLNGYLSGFRLCFHSYLHNSRNKLKA